MKKISTIMLITMLLVSIAGAVKPATAQSEAEPVLGVQWLVENETTQFSHEDQHSTWVFGPQPNVWIGYADNLTEIAENNYRINLGDELFINITVPKAFLGEGNELDVVQFWGIRVGIRAPYFGLEYNATSDKWNSMAFTYILGSDEPRPADFISLDSINSEYYDESDYYLVVFDVTFDLPMAGIFYTGMQVIDTDGRPVSPSWLASNTRGEYGSPPIGFGTAVNPLDFSLPDYYYADIVDETSHIMHYADVNDTFIVRLISNAGIGETLIPFTQLTWDSNLRIARNLTMPVGLEVSESVLFNSNVAWTQTEMDLYPFMFLKVNSTNAYVLAGYLNVTWSWLDLGGNLGMWFPFLTCVENSTIDISKYYVSEPVLTGIFDGRTRIQWGGYFTNETDLDPAWGFGGTIRPEMDLVTVLDVNGDPLIKRPEITTKETMKLAFRTAFIEAFVYDLTGNIADIALQEQPLNLTFLVHRNVNEINGSIVYKTPDGLGLFNISQELKDFTLNVKGSGMDGNDTHYWRYEITHTMVIDFDTGLPTTSSQYRISMYLRGGTQLWSTVITSNDWTVDDYDLELGEDLTTLKIQFHFNDTAPSMVIDQAQLKIGVIQNVRIWDAGNSTWSYPWWLVTAGQMTVAQYLILYNEWTDQYRQSDISSDTLWSPRHLRLGDLPSYTPPIWVVTENGAIDLDGNEYTTNDQYFIKRTGYWSDEGNITINGMLVGVGFDPSPGVAGDEFWSSNWMGVVELNIWYEANETFYWYHASDGSPLSESEMIEIQDLLWADLGNDVSTPGYDYISWLSVNRTINLDNIPGIEHGKWSTTWFAWGTTQNFFVALSDTEATLAHFRAEYAGLLIFNDGLGPTPSAPDFSIEGGQVTSDEVTHLVLIDSVGEVELRRPFGATNNSGSVIVDPDTEVNFGVTITDVNVTIYPLRIEHSSALRGAWDFRESYQGAVGLNSTSFDYWVTQATVDEMSFDITFNVDMVAFDADDPITWNHAVSFKVDQRFGEWTMHDFDDSVLEGRSLAVNFFGVLGTVTATRYTAGQRPVTDTNGASLDASYYQFGAADTPYANVTMGGLPYTWGGDGHSTIYTSGSSTAPIGAFSVMYESASGTSVTNFNIEASMLFMTAGYENWGGEEIICDPVFVAYTSAFQTGSTTTYTTGEGNPITLYIIVGGVVALVIIVCVMYRRR
ncbi:MAG: hypothetical protein JW779_02630 [Candidatus Thorarchaeota archaeon]|nr:hypothetical protein [Candidatus Thorarchaeota archaeon]